MKSRFANASKVMNSFYKRPMINAEAVKDITGLTMPSAYTLISSLEEMGILKEITGDKDLKLTS
jgi:DNA-binding IclR family transcriptional regulator